MTADDEQSSPDCPPSTSMNMAASGEGSARSWTGASSCSSSCSTCPRRPGPPPRSPGRRRRPWPSAGSPASSTPTRWRRAESASSRGAKTPPISSARSVLSSQPTPSRPSLVRNHFGMLGPHVRDGPRARPRALAPSPPHRERLQGRLSLARLVSAPEDPRVRAAGGARAVPHSSGARADRHGLRRPGARPRHPPRLPRPRRGGLRVRHRARRPRFASPLSPGPGNAEDPADQ